MNNGYIYSWEDGTDRGYSIGWNLKTLIQNGFDDYAPPERLEELLEQIIQLVKESLKEWAGPITFNSFDNYILPFVEKEKPSKQGFLTLMEQFFQKISETESEVTISLDLVPLPDFEVTEKAQIILDAVNGVIADIYRSQMQKGGFEPYIAINLYPQTNWDSPALEKWLELSLPIWSTNVSKLHHRNYQPRDPQTQKRETRS